MSDPGLVLVVGAASVVGVYTLALWCTGWRWWRVKPQPRPRVHPIRRRERWRGEDYDDVA